MTSEFYPSEKQGKELAEYHKKLKRENVLNIRKLYKHYMLWQEFKNYNNLNFCFQNILKHIEANSILTIIYHLIFFIFLTLQERVWVFSYLRLFNRMHLFHQMWFDSTAFFVWLLDVIHYLSLIISSLFTNICMTDQMCWNQNIIYWTL